MKIKITEDTLTPWLEDKYSLVQKEAMNLVKYVAEQFYDYLDEYVPIMEDDKYHLGNEGGSLYESGDEGHWITKPYETGASITMVFSGEENPPRNREAELFFEPWFPDQPYGLFQYYYGEQNREWIEIPLSQNEEYIFTSIGEKYWELLSGGT